MNDPTSAKKSSKLSKSEREENARNRIKDRVEAQLARRKASREAKNGINFDRSSIEVIPVESAPVEKLAFLPVVKPVEIVDELAARANRKMMAKLKRAFRKAGKSEASEGEISAFLTSLLEANVPVLSRSSGRISRVVKGEQSIESLLHVRVAEKTA